MRVPRRGEIVNFGGTLRFAPRHRYRPASAAEVLEILDRHAADTIRVAGALHSWSEAARSDDVVLDLGYLDEVSLERDGAAPVAVIGGGCTIARALEQMHRLAPGFTLPGLGGGIAQTLAGAISTGTHGSGGPSLAHFVASFELAAFDSVSGKARIHRIEHGEALRAARCALGCMGAILSLRVPLVPRAGVRETIERCATLDAVLARETDFPLQHFLLLPYRWTYVVWRRKAVAARQNVLAWLHRARLRLVAPPLHLLVKGLAILNDARAT
ncbi:MAG: FAD-binding protein, partial [Acidobacteriota bacterium]